MRWPTINCDLLENMPKTKPGGLHSLAVIVNYSLSLELASSSQGYILKLIRKTVFSKLDAKLDIVQVYFYLKTTMLLKYNCWQRLYAITSLNTIPASQWMICRMDMEGGVSVYMTAWPFHLPNIHLELSSSLKNICFYTKCSHPLLRVGAW